MSNKPPLRAYIVQDAKTEGGKPYWLEVGAVWPHKSGNGFDLVIPDGLSVSGRIVCVESKANSAE